MSDLDRLRALGERIQPPAMALLEETARRRDRRRVLTTVAGGLTAVLVVTGGAVALSSQDRDRTLPEITDPTPTPTVVPTSNAVPTHHSDTSMTPREVVQAEDAELRFAGVSADDPDFAVSVWTAECVWCCYKEFEDSQTRPYFNAMAVTTDGWETATYRRPPMGAGRPFRVLSPAAGVLLVTDFSNGGEWMVYEDGSATAVDRVVEDRPANEARQWFECLSLDGRATWCAMDIDTATAYEWGSPWSGDLVAQIEGVRIPGAEPSAVHPGAGVGPWGRVFTTTEGDQSAWFYRDRVRQTRLLRSDPEATAVDRLAGGAVLGATEDLLYWSNIRGTDELTFHVGDDGGASWRDIQQTLPSSSSANEELLGTPDGAVVLRRITEQGPNLRATIWRLDSLEGGTWELVHDTGEVPYLYDLGETHQLTVVGSRIMLGSLYSDDDGRSWTQPDTWR